MRPDLPIVYGWPGIRVCKRKSIPLREDFVDVVVRHQGDKTLVEIVADRLAAGNSYSLDLVAGCWFKRDGQIVRNPDQASWLLYLRPDRAMAYDHSGF